MQYEIHNMDCVAAMRTMADASVDSIVTDPPYELGFMGKAWDATGIANSVELWTQALRVLKPGGHLLAFSGSRTYHRMTCAIEDAGFEVRDQIMWVYGSGFPKSLDVSKAIDKARDDRAEGFAVGAWLKAEREASGLKQKDVAAMWPSSTGGLTGCVANWETIGNVPKWDQWLMLKSKIGFSDEMDAEVWRLNGRKGTPGNERADREVSAPANNEVFQPTQRVINAGTPVLEAARQWKGWGTALKPAHEPICVARKPLIGTVAANVLAHGTGGLNIDGCRVQHGEELRTGSMGMPRHTEDSAARRYNENGATNFAATPGPRGGDAAGRWPANLIHDGSAEVLALFPNSKSGGYPPEGGQRSQVSTYGKPTARGEQKFTPSEGSAARFFYCAKTNKVDRGANTHPTVKPTDLMAYLVRLVTPPGGLVLDPFMGSGSTGKACMREGFRFVGCELSAEYVAIAEARILNELSGGLL